MNDHDLQDRADPYSELASNRMSISSSETAAFFRPRPPLKSVFSRLSRTVSQAMEPPPPKTSLAPPGSPQDQPADCVGNGRELQTSSPQSALPPLISRFQPSLLLENSGSVARDHLAAERTFLAYVRTSLVVASTGVALVQLFTISSNTTTNDKLSFIPTTRRIQGWARPLGGTMVCFGLIILMLGTTRYFRIQTALTKGMFPVARLTAAGITFGLGTVIIIVFAILLAGHS